MNTMCPCISECIHQKEYMLQNMNRFRCVNSLLNQWIGIVRYDMVDMSTMNNGTLFTYDSY